MTKALVVGNGESRRYLNLDQFNKDFILIGCNAIHRDYKVDYLVCCDKRMVVEAIDNPAIGDTKIFVRPNWYSYFRKVKKNKNIFNVPCLPYIGNTKADKPVNWGSGGYAILLAQEIADEIFLVGFDLYGINGKVNNLYKDTRNYSKKEKDQVDYSFWIYQIAKIFQHSNKKFFIVNHKDWAMPGQWCQSNVFFLNFEQFFLDNKYIPSTILVEV